MEAAEYLHNYTAKIVFPAMLKFLCDFHVGSIFWKIISEIM